MIKVIYDGSFEGFLTAIFDIYFLKLTVKSIDPKSPKSTALFQESKSIITDINKAKRVWKGIEQKAGKSAARFIYVCFLSEKTGVEMLLLAAVKELLKGKANHLKNFRDPQMVDLQKIRKQMGREVHRMHAFVRFRETTDGLWVALIEPDFNVLPLAGQHFKERYPAMRWFIIDLKRRYGLYHEEGKMEFMTLDNEQLFELKKVDEDILTADENAYTGMWKAYFKSVNISERNNDKLQLRHVPKRYRHLMTEDWD